MIDEYDPQIDSADFVEKVDSRYFPLVPGTKFVYEGNIRSMGSDNYVKEVTATNQTKSILGVKTTLVSSEEWRTGSERIIRQPVTMRKIRKAMSGCSEKRRAMMGMNLAGRREKTVHFL
ncbi:TPA: hypothetical protein EYP38_05400 [Candidatus Micrarchaeota archaeon]|nr:hypothetical protein [Candidatus Micrarchaeota archaeon]